MILRDDSTPYAALGTHFKVDIIQLAFRTKVSKEHREQRIFSLIFNEYKDFILLLNALDLKVDTVKGIDAAVAFVLDTIHTVSLQYFF